MYVYCMPYQEVIGTTPHANRFTLHQATNLISIKINMHGIRNSFIFTWGYMHVRVPKPQNSGHTQSAKTMRTDSSGKQITSSNLGIYAYIVTE